MAKFAPCTRCASEAGFLVYLRPKGSAENHFDLDGNFTERVEDRTYFEPVSEAVRCVDCLRVRLDVVRDCTEIVAVDGAQGAG